VQYHDCQKKMDLPEPTGVSVPGHDLVLLGSVTGR
jgi:hypothetical protein